METITDLEVVRIPSVPCKASPICIEKIALIDIGHEDMSKDECKCLEKQLGHIPDMRSFNIPKTFSWAHRSLLCLSNQTLNPNTEADYLMYACLDKGADLPRNEHLHEILKPRGAGRMTLMDPIVVYGDAFVFKMESKSEETEESERARYIHMDDGFVSSMKHAWGANALVAKLMMYPTTRE